MSSSTYYLRSPEEMASIFSEIPESLTNTLLIAERCKLDLGFKGYHLPEFCVPEGYSAQSYLRELCEAGLIRRYGDRAIEYVHANGSTVSLALVGVILAGAAGYFVWTKARRRSSR